MNPGGTGKPAAERLTRRPISPILYVTGKGRLCLYEERRRLQQFVIPDQAIGPHV